MNDTKLMKFNHNGDERGYLVAIEGESDNIPFLVKRVFYIYGSSGDVVRGCHANYNSEFVLINVAGTCKVKTDNGLGTIHDYDLSERNMGVYIPSMVWKDMYDFSEDCILLALSSEHYDPDEYIRDYDLFTRRVSEDGNRRLRILEEKDYEYMLEWMKNPEINQFFKFSLDNISEASVKAFIASSREEFDKGCQPSNLHYAIVDGSDEYYGTVSLKNIDWTDKTAEYAISTRSVARHRGYGQFATNEIIRIAFEDLHLEKIFLYVLKDNSAAIKMYTKCGFREVINMEKVQIIRDQKAIRLYYEINRDEYFLRLHK